MKRKVYEGKENIIVYGKITEAVSKIADDKQLMEKLISESKMSAISEIMQKYQEEVFTILSLSIDGEIDYANVGVYFFKLYTEYFKKFNDLKDDDFFEETATE